MLSDLPAPPHSHRLLLLQWELYTNTSAGQRDLATSRLQYDSAFPELPPTCPAGLRWLVQACLQKEVAHRPNAGRVSGLVLLSATCACVCVFALAGGKWERQGCGAVVQRPGLEGPHLECARVGVGVWRSVAWCGKSWLPCRF